MESPRRMRRRGLIRRLRLGLNSFLHSPSYLVYAQHPSAASNWTFGRDGGVVEILAFDGAEARSREEPPGMSRMRKHGVRGRWIAVLAAAVMLPFLSVAWGQQIHRNGFEAHDPAWVKGPADAVYR